MDISADGHIKMQAAFQKHVDNSISKTINFPNSATRDDVKQGYISAWEQGLKGCTVYRDGSRQEQVLNIQKEEKNTEKKEVAQKDSAQEVTLPPVKEQMSISEDNRESGGLNKKEIIDSKKCPECGNGIQISEGCMMCLSCGFSVCSV